MAGRFSDAWLDALRARVSIEEVVSEYVRLRKKGKRYWGLCPFHNEKTPSFSVDPASQFFYCFGCHKGGTVIQFMMEMEKADFSEAVEMLAERAHMELPEKQTPADSALASERARIYEANLMAARFYHETLWTEEGAQVLSYFYKRGLSDADIRRFGLGASPRSRDGLTAHLTAAGFAQETLSRAGLCTRKDDRAYDLFRGRAIFPIISAQGKVLGFGGRAMGDQQPKYLNTPDTPVFNKRRGLYALNLAKKERDSGRLVLVEGYMDVVSLRKHGVKGVVATLGTALTEEQARLMKRYAPEAWISYDGDAAGQKAALRALDIFDPLDISVRVIDYPSGLDPDDFVRKYGLAGFENLPRYHPVEYRMRRAQDGLDMTTQDGITQYALRGCEILRGVKSPIALEDNLRKLASDTGYDREILLRQIGALSAPGAPSVSRRRPQREAADEEAMAERALISLFSRGQIPPEMLKPEDFRDGVARKMIEWLIEGKAVNAFLEQLEAQDLEQAMKALNYDHLPEEHTSAMDMAEQSLQTIRRCRIRRRMAQIQEEIVNAPPERKRALYGQMELLEKELEN